MAQSRSMRRINLQSQGNWVSSCPFPQRRIPIDGLSVVCQGKFISCIDRITDSITNSSAHRRARHQVSLPCFSTALPPPPLPTHSGSSILIASRSEGSLMATNRRQTRKKRTSFVGQHLTTYADLMRSSCRSSDINRNVP